MVVFEMLLARGARHNARNDGGDTPLHLACAHGNKDVVSKVVKSFQCVKLRCYSDIRGWSETVEGELVVKNEFT